MATFIFGEGPNSLQVKVSHEAKFTLLTFLTVLTVSSNLKQTAVEKHLKNAPCDDIKCRTRLSRNPAGCPGPPGSDSCFVFHLYLLRLGSRQVRQGAQTEPLAANRVLNLPFSWRSRIPSPSSINAVLGLGSRLKRNHREMELKSGRDDWSRLR